MVIGEGDLMRRQNNARRLVCGAGLDQAAEIIRSVQFVTGFVAVKPPEDGGCLQSRTKTVPAIHATPPSGDLVLHAAPRSLSV